MAKSKAHSWIDTSIAPAFNVAGGLFKSLSQEIGDSARSSASTGSTAGQISLLRLEPENLTHKQKIALIINKIEKGELLLAPGKTPTDIVAELAKSDYEGKSVKGMIAELKANSQFLLDDPKLKPAFATRPRLQLLAPSFAAA